MSLPVSPPRRHQKWRDNQKPKLLPLMRQSLSEREQAGDFSAPLCFTHRGNATSIRSGMSPQHIRRAFPISTSQNTRRWGGRDRQNELNEFFFFFLPLCFFFFFAPNKRVQSWGGSSSNQRFAAGEEWWWKRDISTGSSSATQDGGKEKMEKQLRMLFFHSLFFLLIFLNLFLWKKQNWWHLHRCTGIYLTMYRAKWKKMMCATWKEVSYDVSLVCDWVLHVLFLKTNEKYTRTVKLLVFTKNQHVECKTQLLF